MKDNAIIWVLIIAFIICLGGGIWHTIDVIGGGALIAIIATMVVFTGLSILALASSFIIKAFRRPIETPPVVERHFYHDGTRVEHHTIDNRPQPMPQLGHNTNGVYPSLVYGMMRAGVNAGRAAQMNQLAGQEPGRGSGAPSSKDYEDDMVPDDWGE